MSEKEPEKMPDAVIEQVQDAIEFPEDTPVVVETPEYLPVPPIRKRKRVAKSETNSPVSPADMVEPTKAVYSFPTRSRCEVCGSTETEAYSNGNSGGSIQYRRCRDCGRTYKVIGKKV